MKIFFGKLSLVNNLEDFQETVKRFPLSSVCAFLAFIFVFLSIHGANFIQDETLGRFVLSFVLGYFWFGFCQIFSESKGLNNLKHSALALIGFTPLLFIVFGSTEEFFRLFFIIPAMLLLITVAPYIYQQSRDESFWMFNRYVWFGTAIAYVASLLLALGASAALAAVKYLFDVSINQIFFNDIFIFCGFILGPIYALSFVPHNFRFKESECHTPSQVNFVVNWILAPLVVTYMAILYAYFIKIGMTWDIPKGQLSYMIVGFIGVSLVTYLVSWPLHGNGSRALTLIVKYLFPSMIIPVVFQVISIGMRIEQYGFTEKRYVVLLSALWFSFIAGGFLIKKLQLKHIPLSLGILLLIGSWGPWSARDISEWSQVGRLEAVLVKHNLLVDGEIVKSESSDEIPFEVRQNISGIADYIFQHKHKFKGYDNRHELFQELGFDHLSKWSNAKAEIALKEGKFHFEYSQNVRDRALVVKGVDYYIPRQYVYKTSYSKKRHITKDLMYSLEKLAQNKVHLYLNEDEGFVFDVGEVARQHIQNQPNSNKMSAPVVLKEIGKHHAVMMKVYSFSGELEGDKAIVTNVSLDLFITER